MTDADLEAALEAVHDAAPAGWSARRRRITLVMLALIVFGCVPQPSSAVLPIDVALSFGSQATVSVQSPPADTSGEAIVAAITVAGQRDGALRGRVIPVFAVVDCHRNPDCQPGPGGSLGGPARTIWVVLYPDCVDAQGNINRWLVIDAINGLDGGYDMTSRCQ